VAALLGSALLLSACSGSAPSTVSSTTSTTVTGAPISGGTVTWAEGAGASPNYIFPMSPFAYFSVANLSQFQALMYRPLYWYGLHGQPLINYNLSVGKPPVYSGDTVTVSLNHYMWSNGTPVTAGDVIFWMNMLKAEKANWAGYVKGSFPDNVVSYKALNSTTVQFTLNGSYNPTWFTYNELSQITPMPAAWDVTGPGKAGSCSMTTTSTAGCAAVYNYLTKSATAISTYTTSPIWTVVDGPWKLQSFTSTGQATFVPNPSYTGPVKPKISKFVELPFTTSDAEYNLLRTGPSALTFGYIPLHDAPNRATIAGLGYNVVNFYPFAFNYMPLNFNNPTVGPIFRQLYFRQAFQHLVDQTGWDIAFYHGAATPSYGPVPIEPPNPFADAFERANPYPFSVASAKAILEAHGWKIVPGGTSTCIDPAKCGAGIEMGQPLTFSLLYQTGDASFSSSMENLASVAATAGMRLELKTEGVNEVLSAAAPCTASEASCSWQIAAWADSWGYEPDFYPTGGEIFATGAGSNAGSYSSSRMDALIDATHVAGPVGSQRALDAYQNFAASQLPVIYAPYQGIPTVVSTRLAGFTFQPIGFLDPESWYFVR